VVEAENEKKTSVDTVRLAFFKYDRIMHPQLISPSKCPNQCSSKPLKEEEQSLQLALWAMFPLIFFKVCVHTISCVQHFTITHLCLERHV